MLGSSPILTRRCRWLIAGQVQGVGFRPFVFRTASTLGLSGWVRNNAGGVVIEGQGKPDSLRQFQDELQHRHPPLVCGLSIRRIELPPQPDERGFVIASSDANQAIDSSGADVTVDAACCQACIGEMLKRNDRRHRYALINCTDCGPRYSIVRAVPYDRCNTTMAQFEMCPACRTEYINPADRRFHAQPISCPDCGPQIELVNPRGTRIAADPIERARQMLRAGQILAIKGLGGFHLAVRADDEDAVRRLRTLKKRDHKPFALMVASIDAARELVELSNRAERIMRSPACPIVLAPRRDQQRIAPSVAPGSHRLGVMLPYTPIHHLLLAAPSPAPALVMTSGNLSDEPLTFDNDDALRRLGSICDAFLWHDRPIQRGVDDSIILDMGREEPIPLRRARGCVPRAIKLPVAADEPGICLGGELKNTIAVVRNGSAILSQHLGDLTHPQAFEAFRQAIDDLRALFGIDRPRWIAHDLHPAYLSTIYAKQLAAQLHATLVPVQHHHAHAASLMAEHNISGRILCVVCDGTGYGRDGSTWGGELLAADLCDFERLAHLPPLRLPGGDAAARDTARCGLALLHQAFGDGFADHPAARRLVPEAARRQTLCRMIRDDFACARSSGAGRVFDGVAALLGLCSHNEYEAQAAMALEAAAHQCNELPSSESDGECGLDLSPLIREVVARFDRGEPATALANLFHERFAQAWAKTVIDAAERTRLRIVGLSGGVFCNAGLTTRLTQLLSHAGLRVLRHRAVPPNDGGLALGQAAIASAARARVT